MRRYLLLLIGLLAITVNGWSQGPRVLVADLETSPVRGMQVIADKQVPSPRLQQVQNPLNGTQASQVQAMLRGDEAAWAGLRFNVSSTSLSKELDTVSFQAKPAGRSKSIFITLNERDGARWVGNVPVSGEWEQHELPLYRFRWFMGPDARKNSRPQIDQLESLDLWVSHVLQGENGFAVDDLALLNSNPAAAIRVAGSNPTPVPQQQDTTLTLLATDEVGKLVDYTGPVWVAVQDRKQALFPEKIDFRAGKSELPIFVRDSDPITLYLFEPLSQTETSQTLQVAPAQLQVNLMFPGFQGEQVIYVNEPLSPELKLAGSALPRSLHLKIKNHLGRTVISSNFSIADLQAGKARVIVPQPGPLQVEVTALAESISSLPHLYPPVEPTLVSETTTETLYLKDGVTTGAVMGQRVVFEALPTTATVLGRDRHTLFTFANPPRETWFNRWPFGLSSAALFHMELDDFATTGQQRLLWHVKLGSSWGRNDLWWHEIEAARNSFAWQKLNEVVRLYRQYKVKLLGLLAYNAAWSLDRSPDTQGAREEWADWVSRMYERYRGNVWGFEVWNEPNTHFWKPKPDPLAYRELVKTTWDVVRTSGTQVIPGPRIVAGSTAGYDPVFLDKLCSDGYAQYFDVLSFHPYPEARHRSPEDNALPEILTEARELMQKHEMKNTQLWLTEIGWPTGPEGVTEKDQANFLVRAYAISLHKRLNKLFWFNLFDWYPLPWHGTDFGGHSGLLDHNYQPKISAGAYNLMTFMMASMTPLKPDPERQGKAIIYSFDVEYQSVKYDGRLHVAWTPNSGDVAEVELPIVMDGDLYVLDYLGAEHPAKLLSVEKAGVTLNPSSTFHLPQAEPLDQHQVKRYRVKVGYEPLYIWDAGGPPKDRQQGVASDEVP